ncbi:MAG: LysR family transcriptional regulator [Hyphomicrobiales bacterium]|nr:LysR family transcriptional regulator [Hyphomicrobiales bacterium]
MEFHQIRYFLKTAEHLNFTRAAEQCHVSQPALTRAIQKIEEELGGELFSRDGRAVTLSPLGRVMREHFQHIHETQEMARAAARNFLDDGSSELNVGIMCTIGPDVLSAFLNEFGGSNRDVLVILHDIGPDALPELLATGMLDCAFVAQQSDQGFGKLSASALFEEDMVVAFAEGNRFGAMTEVTLFDVAEEAYVDRLKCELRQPFFDFMDLNDLNLNVVCSSQREDWIQELVIRGLGVSVMPRFSITTRRLGWRKLTGPLSNCRQIMIARANGIAPQPPANAFFAEAETFPWKGALAELEENAKPQ